jgi:hypothetical protein
METVILRGEKKSDLKLLLELAKKLGIKSRSLSKQEIQDWLLIKEINAGLKTGKISKEAVMKELTS